VTAMNTGTAPMGSITAKKKMKVSKKLSKYVTLQMQTGI
jgi:hypothetical protein